jgi:uncharacterized LabA/DUF88 family protein
MKQRVSFYIDGFNIYHRIKEYQKKTGIAFNWLNYRSLLESLLMSDEIVGDIYFFTAICEDFGHDSVTRHSQYITALEFLNIKIIQGYFSKKLKKCRVQGCNYKGDRRFPDREEKQTDVNIALALLRDAIEDKYDKCFLLSGDNDFANVLITVMELFPNKKAGLITPPYQDGIVRLNPANQLKSACYHDIKTNK